MTGEIAYVLVACWFLALHHVAGLLADRWGSKPIRLPRRTTRVAGGTVAAVLTVATLILTEVPADATAGHECLTTVRGTHC